MNNITMGDFIIYPVLQKINMTFYDKKAVKYVNMRVIDRNYHGGKSTIITDIKPLNKKFRIPNAFNIAKDTMLHYLRIYKGFYPKIHSIEIRNKHAGKNRIYSIKALLES